MHSTWVKGSQSPSPPTQDTPDIQSWQEIPLLLAHTPVTTKPVATYWFWEQCLTGAWSSLLYLYRRNCHRSLASSFRHPSPFFFLTWNELQILTQNENEHRCLVAKRGLLEGLLYNNNSMQCLSHPTCVQVTSLNWKSLVYLCSISYEVQVIALETVPHLKPKIQIAI